MKSEMNIVTSDNQIIDISIMNGFTSWYQEQTSNHLIIDRKNY